MKSENVTCDLCSKELNETPFMAQYRLVLTVERMPNRGPTALATARRPPISRDYHFCGTGCLKGFIAGLKEEDRL